MRNTNDEVHLIESRQDIIHSNTRIALCLQFHLRKHRVNILKLNGQFGIVVRHFLGDSLKNKVFYIL